MPTAAELLAEKGYAVTNDRVMLLPGHTAGACLSTQIANLRAMQSELDALRKLHPLASAESLLHSLLIDREAKRMTDKEFLIQGTPFAPTAPETPA